MTTHIQITGFGGGLGATVLALAAARCMDEPTLVIASREDVYAHAGIPLGKHRSDNAPHMTVVATDDYSKIVDNVCEFRYVFWDTSLPVKHADIRVGIVRNDYASLWNATRYKADGAPITHWLVREEPDRALSARDCQTTLGVTDLHVTVWDGALARMSDAGLLLYRKSHNDSVKWLANLINQMEVANA